MLFEHIGTTISNAARSFVMALTHARFTEPPLNGPTARYFQHINRYSSAFALASDTAMLIMGGDLKRKETLSARLGDVFSNIYLASMVLKHHRDLGSPPEDLPLVEWSCRTLLYQAQEQLHGFLRNFPNRLVAGILRLLIFPRGRTYHAPSDHLGREIVALLIRPTEARERLTMQVYKSSEGCNVLAQLQAALEMVEANEHIHRKLKDAVRSDIVSGLSDAERIENARTAGVLTADEADALQAQDEAIMELIHVDDFAPEELSRSARSAPVSKKKARKTATRKKKPKADAAS